MTGPFDPCGRKTCATEAVHPGGAHLDPTHRLYDGPDLSLRALPSVVRQPAFALLHAARRANWNVTAVQVALHHLAAEIHRLRDQVAAVRVDRDRGIRAALAGAEDCTEHGVGLRFAHHQAYWFAALADRHDAERVVWLTGIHDISRVLEARTDDWAIALRTHIARVRKQARTARAAAGAPTLADCQRTGGCEHPDTAAHAACERLTATRDGAAHSQEPADG